MRGLSSVVVASAVMAMVVGCAPSVDVEQERAALMAADREWSQTVTEPETFVSYMAADAVMYPSGMPRLTGVEAIRKTYAELSGAPGFALSWTASKAEVGAGGDIGYTAGSYEMSMGGATETGKYVTIWKKQADGAWKVTEDIFNSDAPPQSPPETHVMMAPGALKWGDAPPGLPAGSRLAVISGDPTQAQPYVARAQLPAGYRIPLHWHPTTENLTVLSGTVAVGMGDIDESSMQNLSAGGFVILPKEMRHSFVARTAATIQMHGMGPFAITYVNPADDPRTQTK